MRNFNHVSEIINMTKTAPQPSDYSAYANLPQAYINGVRAGQAIRFNQFKNELADAVRQAQNQLQMQNLTAAQRKDLTPREQKEGNAVSARSSLNDSSDIRANTGIGTPFPSDFWQQDARMRTQGIYAAPENTSPSERTLSVPAEMTNEAGFQSLTQENQPAFIAPVDLMQTLMGQEENLTPDQRRAKLLSLSGFQGF